jgi:hypothetical protein
VTAVAETQQAKQPGLNTLDFKEGIELSYSQSALDHGLTSTSFNFAHLRDLWVRVNLVGMPNVGTLDLKLIDPRGTIAYEGHVPFSPDTNMERMEIPKALHPVTVFHPKPQAGGHSLDYVVPVSGGVLTRYMIPGTWRVEAQFEGVGRVFGQQIQVSTTN